jgi:D-alanine-D-alanine ligase
MSKTRVGILYGGRSGEHEVSLCSAASVAAALDRDKYEVIAIGIARDGKWHVQESPEIARDKDFGRVLSLRNTGSWLVSASGDRNRLGMFRLEDKRHIEVDVVFPVLHGTFGEDGTVQGLLELAMVPYVGADVLGSAVGMDKVITKRLLAEAGIPVVSSLAFTRESWERDQASLAESAVSRLGMPVFVKPACTGSSVGITKVKTREALPAAVVAAFAFDTRVIIEQAIDCREIECSVLGNEDASASVLGEIIPRHEFYSYEAKYIDPDGARLVIPADLDSRLSEAIRSDAVKGYKALACSGMARVDFFLERHSRNFYLNEINTIPGFTSISMYPKLWEATGVSYGELLDRLIQLALDRHRRKLQIKTELS